MQRCLARTIVGSLIIGAAMTTLGCGGGGSEVDKFVGIWEYDLSSISQTCSDGTNDSADGQLNHSRRTFFLGVSSDIIDTSVPTLDKIGTETPTTGTYGLRGKGDELQESWVSTASSTDGTFTCTTTVQAHLVKVARN